MREVREIFFEEVTMFQLRPEGWVEINWVEGTERQREKEGAPGRMKSILGCLRQDGVWRVPEGTKYQYV